eukprot:TRINITY_DN8601_c0_g1_i1.p1 TRINITY_DN8601_c0_g1~~TRINITY_DN8601_c0_g1_i1.p1  ORF type:complete len:155 (+),score=19.18 TRINITY_DN8601_c0_g1_i1:4-468(+)
MVDACMQCCCTCMVDAYMYTLLSHVNGRCMYAVLTHANGRCIYTLLLFVSGMLYRHSWIDVRKLFYHHYKTTYSKTERRNFSSGVVCMLATLGMEFEGREHCGIDDTRNIARLLTSLIKDEAPLQANCDIVKVKCRLQDIKKKDWRKPHLQRPS